MRALIGLLLLIAAVVGYQSLIGQGSAPATPVKVAVTPEDAMQRGQALEENWRKFKRGESKWVPNPSDLDQIDREIGEIPLDWKNAEDGVALVKRLRAIRPEMAKAYAAAEGKLNAALTASREKDLLDKRKRAASVIETTFLDAGRDVYVSAEGAEYRTLRLKYVLMSRPLVHQINQNDKLINSWAELGFRKVILTDGYNSTWTLELR